MARWSVRMEGSAKRDPETFPLGASITPGNLQINSNRRENNSEGTFPGGLGLTLLLSSSVVRFPVPPSGTRAGSSNESQV